MPYESRCRPTSPPTTAAPQFSVPVDVASHTGAMQAQEHRIQRWAVATRTRNPSQEALMSCFSQRITRIRRTESTWKSPEPRITRITRILHSSRQSSRIRVICKGLFEFWPQKTGGIGHERVTRSKKRRFLRFSVKRWLTDGYTDIDL